MSQELEVCSQEPLILAARAAGRWDDASALHLSSCASCREADALAASLRQLIAMHTAKQPPAADVVWMMAQLSQSPRIPWTADIWKGLAGLAACALLLSLAWPAIQQFLSSLIPMKMMSIVPMLVSGIVATTLAIIAFKTRGLLSED